jgi:periplasmic divalent cation tolerance protein
MVGDARPVIVQTNCGTEAEARAIGRTAVEAGLAACANVHGPITAIYRWQGEIAEAAEWVLYFKTTDTEIEALEALVKDQHSYELPAFLVLPISGGEGRYLAWLSALGAG